MPLQVTRRTGRHRATNERGLRALREALCFRWQPREEMNYDVGNVYSIRTTIQRCMYYVFSLCSRGHRYGQDFLSRLKHLYIHNLFSKRSHNVEPTACHVRGYFYLAPRRWDAVREIIPGSVPHVSCAAIDQFSSTTRDTTRVVYLSSRLGDSSILFPLKRQDILLSPIPSRTWP